MARLIETALDMVALDPHSVVWWKNRIHKHFTQATMHLGGYFHVGCALSFWSSTRGTVPPFWELDVVSDLWALDRAAAEDRRSIPVKCAVCGGRNYVKPCTLVGTNQETP